jgi:tRNA 2-selenouridine synthase SelU
MMAQVRYKLPLISKPRKSMFNRIYELLKDECEKEHILDIFKRILDVIKELEINSIEGELKNKIIDEAAIILISHKNKE